MNLSEEYRQYIEKRKKVKPFGVLMPYDWTNLPAKLPITFMAYSQMIGEHSMELANSINELRRLTSSLEAWKSLIEGKSDEGKDELVIEFIDSPTTVLLSIYLTLLDQDLSIL